MKNDSDKITEQKYIELGEDFKELMTVKDNEIIQLKNMVLYRFAQKYSKIPIIWE